MLIEKFNENLYKKSNQLLYQEHASTTIVGANKSIHTRSQNYCEWFNIFI